MTLDRPPVEDYVNFRWAVGDKFDKYMKISNDNANIMYQMKSDNLKLYLVVQGKDTQTRQKWLDDG